jgi:hypothetical protein
MSFGRASRPAAARIAMATGVAFAAAFACDGVAAQTPQRGLGPERTITPQPAYAAGGLHRLLFGDHNRDLWTTTIRVPVLDLATFAGGLTPLQRGGGLQTKSLRLRGADGRVYQFRSVDKDPSSVLPPELHGTVVDELLQDQTSAGHPTASLVVAELLDAVGLLHVDPILVLMPDDARLGEHRADFAGLLGTIEERPEDPNEIVRGFAGADEVVGTDGLLERMEERGDRIAEREFLTARLVDLFLGDWDRHRDQWRWARFGESPAARWRPIPRDRDQAFVRLDGLLLGLARRSAPQLVSFGDDYPNITGLTWNGRELDRRFLVGLERPVWDSIAAFLQSRLSDDVIAAAVRQLPEAHYAVNGADLTRALMLRRDALRDIAHVFYEHLAGEVDVHASDLPELVEVRHAADGSTEVSITTRQPTAVHPFRRRFLPSETDEVRLLLHGGADSVVVTGDGGVRVRVVGGGGPDVFDDRSAGGTRWYDARGDRAAISGRSIDIDRREWTPRDTTPGRPFRDWGTRTLPLFFVGGSPDQGVLAGGGVDHVNFGFRKDPHAGRITLRAAYATGAQTFHVELEGDARRENSPVYFRFDARASGLEMLRFHGFGNDTEIEEAGEFYEVRQQQYALEPELVIPFSDRIEAALGPALQYSSTRMEENRFISIARPYGSEDFGQVGARGRIAFDSRNRARGATSGLLLEGGGSWFPALWDVESAFGALHGVAATYLTAGAGPTLALRAGGRKVFGTYPFHEAAYIGDDETVRLGRKQRFGGDAEVHANAELRQRLGRALIIIPTDIGVHVLGDVGRVYFEGETSDSWHAAVGGGLWIALLAPENVLSVSVARSEERTGVYVSAGFAF